MEIVRADATSPASDSARLALNGGAELVLVVRPAESSTSEPLVALAIVDRGRVISRRDGFDAVTGLDLSQAGLPACESWHARARREAWGLRLSLVCGIGEDYHTDTEVAALFRMVAAPERDVAGLARFWSGIADSVQSEIDSCIRSRDVVFELADATTLKKTITEERAGTNRICPST